MFSIENLMARIEMQESLRENAESSARLAEIMVRGTAMQIRDAIVSCIRDYQSVLSETNDVGMCMVNFGQSCTILVENIGNIGDTLIMFSGKDNNGKPLVLIQHTSQLNFLLKAVEKSPDIPKRTIGFFSME